MDNHRAILKRVGLALIVVGVLDIGYMIYCITKGQSYSSSFNIFAVVAGVFLLRGSLGALRLVTLFAAFMLAGFISAALFLFPFVKPIGLWRAAFHLGPVGYSLSFLITGLMCVFLFWVYRELRMPSVVAARVAAGHSGKPPRLIMVVGAAIPIFLVGVMHVMANTESATKAVALARAQCGDGYEYTVDSISWVGDHVTADVSAYNAQEIKPVHVEWQRAP